MKNEQPVFIMIKRRLVITWIISYLALIGMIAGAVVWSNFQWCGIITTFDETYKESPPTTTAGQLLAQEFNKLSNNFLCK